MREIRCSGCGQCIWLYVTLQLHLCDMCTSCKIQINDLYQKIGKRNSEAEICRGGEKQEEEDDDYNQEGKCRKKRVKRESSLRVLRNFIFDSRRDTLT